MFLSDSVVEPASAVVSATIVVWILLMRRLSVELRTASRGTVAEIHRRDDPVDAERVEHHEEDADQRR
jgi:hypothetical protein